MKALLVRVAADQSGAGGNWNGPVEGHTGRFAYVAIPESKTVRAGMQKPYQALLPVLAPFGIALPPHLRDHHMHLDPDFGHLTYGDQGERAKQIAARLGAGDWIVFYASLADTGCRGKLIYALVGVYVVARIERAIDLAPDRWDCNAHGRRILASDAGDVVVHARPGVSGRLARCIPIGHWHERAYRVRPELLDAWGGLSVRNGYLQRSARLPEFRDPPRFQAWFAAQLPELLPSNNP